MTEPELVVPPLEEFIDLVELSDVVFSRVSGIRFPEDRAPEEIPDTEIDLRPSFSDDGLGMAIAASISIGTKAAQFEAELQLQYKLSEVVAVDNDLMGQFISHSALVTAAPFLREAVVSTAARFRVPVPKIPLLRSGAPLTAGSIDDD